MPMTYFASKISDHLSKTPEGYLICHDVPIARIGEYQYTRGELGMHDGNPNDLVTVYRTPEEVFSDEAIASFRDKPVTDGHPDALLDSSTVHPFLAGHTTTNVRRGTGDYAEYLLSDLMVMEPTLIHKIESKAQRDVSGGYYHQFSTLPDGRLCQTEIRGNHVAIVPKGRAGSRVAIRDSAPPGNGASHETSPFPERSTPVMSKSIPGKIMGWVLGARDADPAKAQEIADQISAELDAKDASPVVPAAVISETVSSADALTAALKPLMESVDSLKAEVATLKAAQDAKDADAKAAADQAATDAAAAKAIADADTIGNLIDTLNSAEESAEGEVGAEGACDDATKDCSGTEGMDSPKVSRDTAIAILKALKPAIAEIPVGERKAATDAVMHSLGLTPNAPSQLGAIIKATAVKAKAAMDEAKAKADRDAASVQTVDLNAIIEAQRAAYTASLNGGK